jgi:hypothetical protein
LARVSIAKLQSRHHLVSSRVGTLPAHTELPLFLGVRQALGCDRTLIPFFYQHLQGHITWWHLLTQWIIRSFPRGLPHLYFFRHEKGPPAGKRFGKDLWYSNWKKLCRNLGIEGVDLYGGTKHSTARAMREYFRPDEIRQGTGIASNKAFERYFQHGFEDELKIYRKRNELRKAGKKMAKDLASAKKGKMIEFP